MEISFLPLDIHRIIYTKLYTDNVNELENEILRLNIILKNMLEINKILEEKYLKYLDDDLYGNHINYISENDVKNLQGIFTKKELKEYEDKRNKYLEFINK